MATVKTLIGNIKGNPGNDGKDGSENQIYSTDEQVIGTWIDGKPLYRKTMQFSGLSSGENKVSHGIANIDYIFADKNHSVLTNATKSEFWQTGNSNQDSSNSSQFSTNIVWINSSYVDIYIGSGIVSRVPNLILTLEYTKTTDTATT